MTGQKRITEFHNEGLIFDVKDQGPLDGPVILLLHGFPMTNACWDHITPILNQQGFRTIAPNQRGYTARANPQSVLAYRMTKLIDDINVLVNQIGQKVYFVGHDWGALVGWNFTTEHPDKIHRLIAVSIPSSWALIRSIFTSDQLFRVYYVGLFQAPIFPELFIKNLYPVFKKIFMSTGLNADEMEWINQRVFKAGFLTGSLNWYRALAFTSPLKLLKKVHRPTTFIWGAKDASVNRNSAENAVRSVSGSYQFITLEEATHWIPLQHPKELADIILNSIRQSTIQI